MCAPSYVYLLHNLSKITESCNLVPTFLTIPVQCALATFNPLGHFETCISGGSGEKHPKPKYMEQCCAGRSSIVSGHIVYLNKRSAGQRKREGSGAAAGQPSCRMKGLG